MEIIEELTEIYLNSRNLKTFEKGFINRLTDKCRMLYFPKFEAFMGTVMQIEKTLINGRLRVLKVS